MSCTLFLPMSLLCHPSEHRSRPNHRHGRQCPPQELLLEGCATSIVPASSASSVAMLKLCHSRSRLGTCSHTTLQAVYLLLQRLAASSLAILDGAFQGTWPAPPLPQPAAGGGAPPGLVCCFCQILFLAIRHHGTAFKAAQSHQLVAPSSLQYLQQLARLCSLYERLGLAASAAPHHLAYSF